MRLSFSNPQSPRTNIYYFGFGDNWYIGMYRPDHRILWQYGLSSFQERDTKLDRFCQYNFFIFDQKYIYIILYPSLGNLSTQIAQIIEYDLWFWILPYRDKINRTEIFWHIRSFHGYWLAYFFCPWVTYFFVLSVDISETINHFQFCIHLNQKTLTISLVCIKII